MTAVKVQSMQNNPDDYACADTSSTTHKMALVAAAACLVILVEIWIVSFIVGVAPFPNGAPTSACLDLKPYHGARLMGFAIDEIRDGAAPFDLKTNQIDPSSYKGVISGTIPFRAFMVQARIDGSQQVVGKFIRFDGDMTKTLACSQADDTITHTDDNLKQQITFVWHVDDFNIPERRIHFVATVAKSYSEFWTNVTSEAITIGSPITEMAATTLDTPRRRQSVPEENLDTRNPEIPAPNMQGKQNNSRQRRQHQWHQLPDGREVLETEELHLPPEMNALFKQLPIQPNDFFEHQHFGLNQLLVPTIELEPKTSTQNALVSKMNASPAQEASNPSAVTIGSRRNQEGWKKDNNNNQSAIAQSRAQRVTANSRAYAQQTTPGGVDLPRISVNNIGASNNFKLSLSLYAAICSLIILK